MQSLVILGRDSSAFDNLSKEIKELANAIQVKNYIVSITNESVRDTGILQEKLTVLENIIAGIKSNIIEKTNEVENEIRQQTTAFNTLYADISEQLSAAHLDSTELRKVKIKLDSASTMPNTDNLDAVSFAKKKLASVELAVRDLTVILPSQKQRVTDSISDKIALVETAIGRESSAILNEVIAGNFVFNAAETRLVNAVKELQALRESPPSSDVQPIYADRIKQQQELEQAIVALRTVVVTHQQAIAIIKSDSIDNLINKLNDSTTKPELLAAVKQNLNLENLKPLLNNIDKNLHKLNATGLAALSTFLRDYQSPDVTPIKDKLQFIEIAGTKGIAYIPMLTNAAAIAAAIALNTDELNHFITKENLENPNFCQTIALLKELKIELTTEKVNALVDDPQKCMVIAQQAALHQRSLAPFSEQANESYLVREREGVEKRNKISPDHLKALIEDFLKTDKAVAQALSNIIEIEPQHSLLVLVKESPELQALLADKNNSKSAMPFLKPVLEQINNHNQLFLSDYLSQNKQIRASAVEGFQQVLTRNNTLLSALLNAAKQPKCRMSEMTLVMNKLNEFISEQQHTHANDHIVLGQLSQFRREAIPMLLTDKPMSERQTDVVNLANNTFKQSGILSRILECIYKAFSAISLQATASKTERFIFSEQNVAAKEKLATGFQSLGSQVKASLKEIKGEDGEQPESVAKKSSGQ